MGCCVSRPPGTIASALGPQTLWAVLPRESLPATLTVTPEMMGALPSMSLCTSRMASSLLLSLNLFLESSSSASLNCSNVMVRQDFPLRERALRAGPGHSPPWCTALLTSGVPRPCLGTQ